jgi:hypothetical protein
LKKKRAEGHLRETECQTHKLGFHIPGVCSRPAQGKLPFG